jgi:hypothetical protein
MQFLEWRQKKMGNAAHAFPDRAQRFPLTVPLHYRKSGMPHWIDAQTVNISRTGILFRTDETIPSSSVLDVRVDFPAHSTLECRCTVVRTDASLIAVQIQRHNLVHS